MKIVKYGLVALLVVNVSCVDTENGETSESSHNQNIEEGLAEHDCFDREYEGYREEENMMASDLLREITGAPETHEYPSCTDNRDIAFHQTGEMCASSNFDVHEEYYFYCNDPEWEDQETGEVTTRTTPCIWWVLPEKRESGACEYRVGCISEERLPEYGWPEGESFEYHTEEMAFDLCDPPESWAN